jgi:fumarylacetoacetate (FAA) hydrolase
VKLGRTAEGCGLVDGDRFVPVAGDLLDVATGRVEVRETGPPAPLASVRLLAPVPRPPSVRDFFAFEAHVKAGRVARGLEMEPDWYTLPVFYFSSPHSILGPDDVVPVPATEQLDYELEIAAVIGRDGRDVPEADAPAYVAGYTVMNDWSARDVQMREMRMLLGPAKGKDFATSLGPVLATPDEVPPAATMTARVNGDEWSRGSLGDIHFPFARLISHAARDTWIRAGDVVGSGTVGTGCVLELSLTGHPRARWLEPGDVVELEIEGIGVLRNVVGARRC